MKKQTFLAFLLTAALLISTAFPSFALAQNDTLEQQNGVFVVYFETGGGTGIPVIATTTSSGKLAELPTPTMSGYTFEGWYTDELEGDKITLNTEFASDATIYARWLPNLKSTASVVPSAPATSGFRLKAHIGTMLVVGTLVVTFAVLASK